MKCDCSEGTFVNGKTGPVIFTLALDKATGSKVLCQPETTHFKKLKKSTLKTITLYSEYEEIGDVFSYVETISITFTLL